MRGVCQHINAALPAVGLRAASTLHNGVDPSDKAGVGHRAQRLRHHVSNRIGSLANTHMTGRVRRCLLPRCGPSRGSTPRCRRLTGPRVDDGAEDHVVEGTGSDALKDSIS